jgi:hypothetical protein
MNDIIMVFLWIAITLFVFTFVHFFYIAGEVWQRINEYENMKRRGFTLMKDDNDDDFWVGYGD